MFFFTSFFILIVLKGVKEDELMLCFAITSGISRFHASPVALVCWFKDFLFVLNI